MVSASIPQAAAGKESSTMGNFQVRGNSRMRARSQQESVLDPEGEAPFWGEKHLWGKVEGQESRGLILGFGLSPSSKNSFISTASYLGN